MAADNVVRLPQQWVSREEHEVLVQKFKQIVEHTKNLHGRIDQLEARLNSQGLQGQGGNQTSEDVWSLAAGDQKCIKGRVVRFNDRHVCIETYDGFAAVFGREAYSDQNATPFQGLKVGEEGTYLVRSYVAVDKLVHMKCLLEEIRADGSYWRVKWRDTYGSLYGMGITNADFIFSEIGIDQIQTAKNKHGYEVYKIPRGMVVHLTVCKYTVNRAKVPTWKV